MGLFKKSGKNVKDLIQERTRLARQVIPILREQVRLNPADGIPRLKTGEVPGSFGGSGIEGMGTLLTNISGSP